MDEAENREWLERVAYHEAAHVVACILERKRFYQVTIQPGEDFSGRVLMVSDDLDPEMIDLSTARGRHEIERQVAIRLAGPAQDCRRFGISLTQDAPEMDEHLSPGGDLDTAAQFAEIYCEGYRSEASAWLKWQRARAERLWASPLRQVQVEAIAQALLTQTTLTYRSARQITGSAADNFLAQRKLP